ncbi:MAG: hypothetical protein PF542_00950 [Nanoarchaeota archaeon]|jgi:uncharacterized membrane protein|nr:hypothetical protein [Nanoarchaeota archaeon]
MKMKNIPIILGILILTLSSVSAFAVSSKYWDENPVIISPGETITIETILQNMAGSENIEATATISGGSEIAKLMEPSKTYLINAAEKTNVPMQITIPKENFQERYVVVISFKSKTAGEGDFSLGSSIEREIPIQVTQIPQEAEQLNRSYQIIAILGIVIIGLIIFLLLKKPKNKKKKKKIIKKK